MFEALKAWWVILVGVGPLGLVGRQSDLWIRYFVVEALGELGLFQYLDAPRSYGQIVTEFGFVDSPFTRDVLDTLASGRDSLVLKEENRYCRNASVPMPDRDKLARRTPEMLHKMSFFRDFAQQIPARMRQEPVDFVRHFEEAGPAVLSFDQSLSTRIYGGLRKAALAFVDKRELRGKKLLDLGCGSGYETADIWIHLDGDVQITAVDPAPGLLRMADQQFAEFVRAGKRRNLPSLTEANRPSFQLMSATHLEFPDESFDVVYHSLILHWLSDPRRGVSEVARVLKPGGMVFGTQFTKPTASPWQNLMFTVHEGVYGTFWEEEFRRWYQEVGISLTVATPAGVFKGYKQTS